MAVATEPKVHFVDDNDDFRSSVKRLVEHGGLNCSVYASAEEFLDHFDPAQPGCLVLDIRMPGTSGLKLQEHLVQKGIEMPVIILTGHADVPVTLRAWKNGAFEFLEKPVSKHVLMETIREAIEKDRAERRSRRRRTELLDRIKSLTRRERQVMALVVSGKANRDIGEELGLSQKTVEVHRANVMHKMGADSLASLVRLVIYVQGQEDVPL